MKKPLVIIGSGHAGYTLARAFRQLDSSTPVIILTQDGGEQFGMLFQKDNPLVGCVNAVLTELKDSGALQAIQDEWLAGTTAPYFKE